MGERSAHNLCELESAEAAPSRPSRCRYNGLTFTNFSSTPQSQELAMSLRFLFGSLALCSAMICGGASAQDANTTFKPDVVYGHKDGMALTFDVFEPKSNAKGVGLLFMVSGGWVSQWTPPQQGAALFAPFLKSGYTVFAVRHGSSPRYVIPEIAVDVRSALKYIYEHADELKVDRERLGVFGFSAGGHLSLMLGTRPVADHPNGEQKSVPHAAAIAAVVPPTDLAPYVDPANPLREQFPALKFDPAKAADYSPLNQVSPDDPPTLLVHGDKDELVPIWHSQKLDAALADAKVAHKLVVIEGGGHSFNKEGNQKTFTSILEWFDETLAKPK